MKKIRYYYITDNGGCPNFTSGVGKNLTKIIQNITMMLAKTLRLQKICSKQPCLSDKKTPQ